MKSKKRGRPSKIDVETMKTANIGFIIIIIILFILLSVSTITILNPNIINYIKASLRGLMA